MKTQKSPRSNQFVASLGIIMLTVIMRLLPHPPNFTPIAGLALFSGAHLDKRLAFILPLLSMFLSDLFLGFHSTIIYVYGSFFITVLIGFRLKNNKKAGSLVLASLSSSILFFLITNFGVWLSFNMYPKSLGGLLNCYLMGLPFFRNTILGDLFYSFIFFYGYKYLILKIWVWVTGTLCKSATVPQR